MKLGSWKAGHHHRHDYAPYDQRQAGERDTQNQVRYADHSVCQYSQGISDERAQKLGIRKYIEKPIEMEKLARSVREALDGQVNRMMPRSLIKNAFRGGQYFLLRHM